ncbi:hypothetical protein R69658_05426 [Paraburkholderia aspalathi]|uniref:Uncharacterized protein n=1 Tax=Paraburkholderia aspalathi TaxID=1324617 RepID=A0ABM8SI58_9BURK|nr:hypothetical protein [Paraburkholderia aspalathi]MBK3821801.1 hypothetical protein [Paraburkholderia aspalathi]MBK3833595.1 hypothetical protein [Paraburkholderia aspalathi]MBK3863318.1 hypothetical protein [Paraburkholderia aspalathi]CAE6811507.1 hypothetical protein R69658_05426 [Paraburkholderia aspalathi]
MPTVFIAGSITIKLLDVKVKECIDKIVKSNYDVLVGDADGADTSIQQYLSESAVERAIVYCSGWTPRNNLGNWTVHHVETSHAPGSRAFFTAKDLEMAKAADYGLMIWDAKSTGTLSNVIELLRRKKKARVFVNKDKVFKDVGDVAQLEQLVSRMSEAALKKADAKIRLFEKINTLKHEQSDMFAA